MLAPVTASIAPIVPELPKPETPRALSATTARIRSKAFQRNAATADITSATKHEAPPVAVAVAVARVEDGESSGSDVSDVSSVHTSDLSSDDEDKDASPALYVAIYCMYLLYSYYYYVQGQATIRRQDQYYNYGQTPS